MRYPINLPADLWDTALYFAVKETSRDFSYLPPVREIFSSDFGALTYEVDDTDGTTKMKPAAYEAEPYTGRVILENNGTQILVAYINRGRLAETGTLWNDTGELVLAENHYDELGYPAQAKEWDEDGQLIAQRPQVDPTQPTRGLCGIHLRALGDELAVFIPFLGLSRVS